MKTKAELASRRVGTLLRTARGGMIAALLLACGGALGEPQTSGESHFLRHCDDSCGASLACISNVCTRACLVGKSSCRDLAGAATCTDQSIEPGQVAVCDQACMQDSDCAALGTGFSCESGFCRGAKLGGTGDPSNPPVIECPANVKTDPLTVVRMRFRGDVFDVDVTHGGGCATHDYTLCYGPEFLESFPVQTPLRLIHDAHDDSCDALISRSLHFDLKPLADTYARAYHAPSGIISTSYGMYLFGTPSCDERSQAADSQVGLAVKWAQAQDVLQSAPSCAADTECKQVRAATSCSDLCSAGIANSRTDDLAEGLAAIENAVCGDFAKTCPERPQTVCTEPPPLACTNGSCVDAM